MEYIVLGRGSGATLLAQALEGRALTPREMPLRELKRLYRNPRACVINWGWSTAWANLNRLGRTKRWCKNKATASHEMIEADVRCAEYIHATAAMGLLTSGIYNTMLERQTTHSKGRDIREVDEYGGIRTDRWYVPIFRKDREYRAHVLHGEVIKLQRKIPEDPQELVWSNDHATFQRVRLSNAPYARINDIALRAVAALGLDMGAVDIGTQGWDKGRGPREVIVFEVNTAPALNEETAERYAEKVKERYE